MMATFVHHLDGGNPGRHFAALKRQWLPAVTYQPPTWQVRARVLKQRENVGLNTVTA